MDTKTLGLLAGLVGYTVVISATVRVVQDPLTPPGPGPEPAPVPPPPPSPAGGFGKRLMVFYYGRFDLTFKNRILNSPPEFLVLETPGGSYHRAAPSKAEILELQQAAGIKVLSYIPTGNMVGYKYNSDSPPNDRAYVRQAIKDVSAEGCAGAFFDEGGVGNWRYPGGLYSGSFMDMDLAAPALDINGQPNSWAGYTMRDWIDLAHQLGLYVVSGNASSDPRYTKQNAFDVLDQFFIRETTAVPWSAPIGMEVGNESKCCALSYGDTLESAVRYSKDALAAGFRSVYAHINNGTLPPWYEDYYNEVFVK